MIKSDVSFNIYTLLHCITGMKQYENKSLEVSMNEWTNGTSRWIDIMTKCKPAIPANKHGGESVVVLSFIIKQTTD